MPVIDLSSGTASGRDAIGGKAWSIARMLRLGIPVPPAFVLTTDECRRFHEGGGQIAADALGGLPAAMRRLEVATGRTFGGGEGPLLVSVRSGAAASMPGMMDTILNLGINDAVQAALAADLGDPFVTDLRGRFEREYAGIVGYAAPSSPWEQLHGAIAAVFHSWHSPRAMHYRKDRGIAEEGGTAVTVQAMVFGNLDERSGTGVLFTRNPLTGSPEPYGEWLPKAQGEDVVSGRCDPLGLDALAKEQPAVHATLLDLAATLERDGRDVQDIEFTVEGGRLWLLQTRAAKRTAAAAVRLAVDLANEGLIDRRTAVARVTSDQLEALRSDHVEPVERGSAQLLATGRPAATGVACGEVVTDVDEAEDRALAGEAIVLARATTNPDDVHAMSAVNAVLTEIGGTTSHAAVVSRELGTPCVVGCGRESVTSLAGRTVTVDAAAGQVFAGDLLVTGVAADNPDLTALMSWACETTEPEQVR